MTYDDRVYHGVQGLDLDDDSDWEPAQIFVEEPEPGPTERQNAAVLYQLRSADEGLSFGWGYNGSGTSVAAAAVLADVLDLDASAAAGLAFGSYPEDEALADLREDFCEDVLSQLCDEWRLRRGAILRWARGWYLQRGITPFSAVLRELPPLPSTEDA